MIDGLVIKHELMLFKSAGFDSHCKQYEKRNCKGKIKNYKYDTGSAG